MTMTVTACVTVGGGTGGQEVSKAPPPPQHIETTKGNREGDWGVWICIATRAPNARGM